MKKDSELSGGDFENLLAWLAPDRDAAGAKYEELRNGLIRFFRIRSCRAPETLADRTLNRVAAKLSEVKPEEKVKKISFALGFAFNVYLEYASRRHAIDEIPFDPVLHDRTDAAPAEREDDFRCLEKCLARLSSAERKLLVKYYSKQKSEKFEWRKKIAAEINSSVKSLHLRIHRIKRPLKDCVKKCLKEK